MLVTNFSPFPVLESDRLVLRQITKNDVNAVFMLRSNPQTMQYIPRPLAKTNADAMDLIELISEKIAQNTDINWAITVKNSTELVGIIGHYRINHENYRSEIGYILHPIFHNRGIITEAIKLILHYGFDSLKLHSVEAIIDPSNYASEKVLLKNGFVKEAHFIENGFYNGKFIDSAIYSLLSRNFIK